MCVLLATVIYHSLKIKIWDFTSTCICIYIHISDFVISDMNSFKFFGVEYFLLLKRIFFTFYFVARVSFKHFWCPLTSPVFLCSLWKILLLFLELLEEYIFETVMKLPNVAQNNGKLLFPCILYMFMKKLLIFV